MPDINNKYVFWHPKGKPFSCYQSKCPHYEGYYLGGVRSAVKCTACPELLPGIVVDTIVDPILYGRLKDYITKEIK